jgi:hypothetical protein
VCAFRRRRHGVYGVGTGEFLDESSPVVRRRPRCGQVERDAAQLADAEFCVVFLRNYSLPLCQLNIVLNDLCARLSIQ